LEFKIITPSFDVLRESTKISLTRRNQSWPHWKGIANEMSCSGRPHKPTGNQQEKQNWQQQQCR